MTKAKENRSDAKRLLGRPVIRLRLLILRGVCRILLPRNLWIGKHHGAYTQRWEVVFGRLDGRGVLQGVTDDESAV